jgi:hypothetical protein
METDKRSHKRKRNIFHDLLQSFVERFAAAFGGNLSDFEENIGQLQSLWTTLLATVAPGAQPNLIRIQDSFGFAYYSLQQVPRVIIGSEHLRHGTAGRAYATFKAVLEFFTVQYSVENFLGNRSRRASQVFSLLCIGEAQHIRVYKRKGF